MESRTKEECINWINSCERTHEYELVELGKRIPLIKRTIYEVSENG